MTQRHQIAAQFGKRPGSIPPPMSKVGHAANRLSPEQLEKFVGWLKTLKFPDGEGGRKVSQYAIADKTGVRQSFIHYLFKGKNTTVGTARSMMLKAGTDPKSVLGTDGALGRYEELDKMTNRGQVLDALSAFYDEDFLTTCQSLAPPDGSDGWSHHRWNRYITDLRDQWDSGQLKPKKRSR